MKRPTYPTDGILASLRMNKAPQQFGGGFTAADFDEMVNRIAGLPINPDWKVDFEKVEGGYMAYFSGGIHGRHFFTDAEYLELKKNGEAKS